mmetsp:Transcript_9983/g.29868  ORF Transcript_9983/g.29868 Transcript_9983/m.29868 type:complete len:259 (+) Transcript_9983:392-1168(+)
MRLSMRRMGSESSTTRAVRRSPEGWRAGARPRDRAAGDTPSDEGEPTSDELGSSGSRKGISTQKTEPAAPTLRVWSSGDVVAASDGAIASVRARFAPRGDARAGRLKTAPQAPPRISQHCRTAKRPRPVPSRAPGACAKASKSRRRMAGSTPGPRSSTSSLSHAPVDGASAGARPTTSPSSSAGGSGPTESSVSEPDADEPSLRRAMMAPARHTRELQEASGVTPVSSTATFDTRTSTHARPPGGGGTRPAALSALVT